MKNKIFCLLILLFFPFSTFVQADQTDQQSIFSKKEGALQTPTFIFLQKEKRVRAQIENFLPEEGRIILITKEKSKLNLSEKSLARCNFIYELAEFSEKNVVEILGPIVNACGKENLFIITNEESSLIMAAKIREIFELSGPNTQIIEKFRNKLVMKEILEKHEIRIPRHVHFDTLIFNQDPEGYLSKLEEYLKFPIFAKPIDGASSEGVCKIVNSSELKSWANDHKDEKNFELDEFIEGVLYHYDSLIQDGKIIFSSGAEYIAPCFDFMLNSPIGSVLMSEMHPLYHQAKEYNKRILEALNPPNGCTHLEFFATSSGELVFVEIAARSPGAHVPECYSKKYHFNLEELSLRLQMGLQIDGLIDEKIFAHSAWVYYPFKEGIVKKITEPNLKSSHNIFWNIEIGESIVSTQSIREFAIAILLWNEDDEILKKEVDALKISSFYETE